MLISQFEGREFELTRGHLFKGLGNLYNEFIPFFKSSQCSKELNHFCPPSSSDDLCLLFCFYPFYFISYLMYIVQNILYRREVPGTYLRSWILSEHLMRAGGYIFIIKYIFQMDCPVSSLSIYHTHEQSYAGTVMVPQKLQISGFKK